MSKQQRFPDAVEPYDHTTFLCLKDGERFRFATELTGKAMGAAGVAQKIATRGYRFLHNDEVGTSRLDAVVLRVDEEGRLLPR